MNKKIETEPHTYGSAAPDGVSAVPETFGVWTVSRALRNGKWVAAVTQHKTARGPQKAAVAIDIVPVGNGRATGMLILPFGLRLATGVSLKVDSQRVSYAFPFATALPIGCMAALDLDEALIGSLRAGSVLKIAAGLYETGRTAVFQLSLEGFVSAYARAIELSGTSKQS